MSNKALFSDRNAMARSGILALAFALHLPASLYASEVYGNARLPQSPPASAKKNPAQPAIPKPPVPELARPAPPSQAARPVPLTACDPGGCWDGGANRYNSGGGNTYLNSAGKLCTRNGTWMQCF